MWDDIGSKLKGLAKAVAYGGFLVSIILGLALLLGSGSAWGPLRAAGRLSGLGVMVGGSLLAWLGSLQLYGFGELIDRTTQIAANTAKEKVLSHTAHAAPSAPMATPSGPVLSPPDSEDKPHDESELNATLRELGRLRDEGAITDADYAARRNQAYDKALALRGEGR